MNKKAFTLIELLVVVLIISTLASIAAPQYLRVIERFKVLEATTAITEIKKAQEFIMLKKGRYSNRFEDFDFQLKDENGKECSGTVCELKYFILEIRLYKGRYVVYARRKSNEKTRPPVRYSNYIYFYDSKTNSFGCTDANCVRDFID